MTRLYNGRDVIEGRRGRVQRALRGSWEAVHHGLLFCGAPNISCKDSRGALEFNVRKMIDMKITERVKTLNEVEPYELLYPVLPTYRRKR